MANSIFHLFLFSGQATSRLSGFLSEQRHIAGLQGAGSVLGIGQIPVPPKIQEIANLVQIPDCSIQDDGKGDPATISDKHDGSPAVYRPEDANCPYDRCPEQDDIDEGRADPLQAKKQDGPKQVQPELEAEGPDDELSLVVP